MKGDLKRKRREAFVAMPPGSPVTFADIQRRAHLSYASLRIALDQLVKEGHVSEIVDGPRRRYQRISHALPEWTDHDRAIEWLRVACGCRPGGLRQTLEAMLHELELPISFIPDGYTVEDDSVVLWEVEKRHRVTGQKVAAIGRLADCIGDRFRVTLCCWELQTGNLYLLRHADLERLYVEGLVGEVNFEDRFHVARDPRIDAFYLGDCST